MAKDEIVDKLTAFFSTHDHLLEESRYSEQARGISHKAVSRL